MNYKPGQIATAPNGNKWERIVTILPGQLSWKPHDFNAYTGWLTDGQVTATGLTVTDPPDEPSMVEGTSCTQFSRGDYVVNIPESFAGHDLIVIRKDRVRCQEKVNLPYCWPAVKSGDTVIVVTGGGL